MEISFIVEKDSLRRIVLELRERYAVIKNRLFNIFSKTQEPSLAATFPIQREIVNFTFENFHSLYSSHPVQLNNKPLKIYRSCIGKIGELAEKSTANLGNLTFPDQINVWNLLKSNIEKHPGILLNVVDGKNRIENKIVNKLRLLVKRLEEISIDVDILSLDQAAEQIETLYEIIEDRCIESSPGEIKLLIETKDLLVELHGLLQEHQNTISNFRAEEYVRDTLENTPLFAELTPLALSSAGAALSAFMIDQQGLLPPAWNPSKCISDSLLTKICSILSQARSVGCSFITQDTKMFLENVTLIAGTSALVSCDDIEQDNPIAPLNYLVSSLVNQVFVFTFAYIGTRVCGSKERMKSFVENRISSTIAYKTCSVVLEVLGTPFYLNKSASLLASATINPLLKFID